MVGLEPDEGAQYFELNEDDTEEIPEGDLTDQRQALELSVDRQAGEVQLMRKSNFLLKSKIDIISDLLQVQKEKHQVVKQEINKVFNESF